jgi:glutathione S-transferase
VKLFWSARSPYVRKVMVVAHELGLADAIALEPVTVTLRTRAATVVAANPLGQIPTLISDTGTALYGSAVICRYLASLVAGASLFPADPPAQFDALTREALGDGMLDALMRWFSERNRAGDPKSAEYIAVSRAKLLDSVTQVERNDRTLGTRPFDIGAAALGCALAYADFRFAEADWRSGHPIVAAWYETLAARPSFALTAFDAG